MNIPILIQGLIIGFSVAMPIGPIGILCIRRTLLQGRLIGIITGLGVATADAIYGSIAAFGISFISNFLINNQNILKITGGSFLLFLGIKILSSENSFDDLSKIKKTNIISSYTSSLFLTLTNPITILLFASIFSWWNIVIDTLSTNEAWMLILGIFSGSLLWFTILSLIVGILRSKFVIQHLIWINQLSAIILIGFSILTFATLIIH